MGDAPDLVQSFYNLPGELLGERKKNLYTLLLKPSSSLSEQQISDAFNELKPRNYQENIFYLDALIYFRRTQQLKEMLKEGNQLFAAKILKHSWFCEIAFNDTHGDGLVDNFFPYLSFVARKKLINRICKCWNEEKIDGLFNSLHDRYGLTQALEVLHKCSFPKTKSVIEEFDISLRPNQIMQLYDKSEELFVAYVDHLQKTSKIIFDNVKVLRYIALKNPKLVVKLEKENKICMCTLGRRTTKNLIKTSKSEILDDPKPFTKFLKKDAFVRAFSPNFQAVFKKLLSKNFSKLKECPFSILEHYPKKNRWTLFFMSCLEIFPTKSVADILPAVNDLSILYPPKEIKEKWALILLEKEKVFEYIKWLPISAALNIVRMTMDSITQNYEKELLMRQLLENCKLNNDLDDLVEVVKFSLELKRPQTISKLLWNIMYKFDLRQFNEKHWSYIYRLMEIISDREILHFDVFARYLEFLFKNGYPHKNVLNLFLSNFYDDIREFSLNNPQIEKKINMELCNTFPQTIKTLRKENEHKSLMDQFIISILKFCAKNKDHCIKISNYPPITTHINLLLERKENFDNYDSEVMAYIVKYNFMFPEYALPVEDSVVIEKFIYFTKSLNFSVNRFSNIISEYIARAERTELAEKLFQVYLNELIDDFPENNIISYLLTNEPRKLVPHLEAVLKHIVKPGWYPLNIKYNILKQYSHLDLDKKAAEFFRQQLVDIDKKDLSEITQIVKGITTFLTIEEYIAIVEHNFLPKQDKLDIKDEEMRKMYRVQCTVSENLAKVLEPYKMLPLIMKFVRGDYLQTALPALYCAFYQSPQRILYSYTEQLQERQAASTKKHSIFLSCAVLDKKYTLDLLNKINKENISIQKNLFSATLKYFYKTQSTELFSLILDNLQNIDKNDTETLDNLKNIRLPIKYRSRYVEKAWMFFEDLVSKDVYIEGQFEKLFEYMCQSTCTSLSSEFVASVINKHFKYQDSKLKCASMFVLQVLKQRKSERNENFKLVFDLLSKFDKPHRKTFFNDAIVFIRTYTADRELIDSFSMHWKKNFTLQQSFNEHIYLELFVKRLDYEDMDIYAEHIVTYMNNLIPELDYLVFPIFKDTVKNYLSHIPMEEKLNFYNSLLKNRPDTNTYILILLTMDYSIDKDYEELDTIYMKLIETLKNVDIPIVKAYYKSYFSKIKLNSVN